MALEMRFQAHGAIQLDHCPEPETLNPKTLNPKPLQLHLELRRQR